MSFSKSHRYVGYIAALSVCVLSMMSYASANDKQVAVTYNVKHNTPNNLVTAAPAADQAANLAPAAGTDSTATSAAKPAPKAVVKKKTAKKTKKTVKKNDDDAIDDASDTAIDNDPIEPFNRVMFEFNHAVDTVLLRPVTVGYRFIVCPPARTAVSHFLDNLYSPVTFANSVFQADPQNSFATFWRFILNTTFGFGGLYDFASEVGLKNRTTSLGDTFAIYGADAGPYIVIPIMGPSDIRDGVGSVGDIFLFPPNYSSEWAVPLAIGAASAIDARSNNMELIDGIYKSSIDPYATLRSAYTQKRAEDIRRAKAARKASQDKAAAQ